eukprot:scaffold3213_cov66-Phaeocystis_antarctica.AAC.3
MQVRWRSRKLGVHPSAGVDEAVVRRVAEEACFLPPRSVILVAPPSCFVSSLDAPPGSARALGGSTEAKRRGRAVHIDFLFTIHARLAITVRNP